MLRASKILLPIVFSLALYTGTAAAAPPSPSVSYAYRLAEQNWGAPALCTSIDVEIVSEAELAGTGESSAPAEPEPCYINVSRRIAAPHEFGAACLLMFNVFALLNNDWDYHAVSMPKTCRAHLFFLFNHPHYLRRFE